MHKFSQIAAAVVLLTSSIIAHAWWDNWNDDFFGDGFSSGGFDFGFSMGSRGYARGYEGPYWGYAPYHRSPPYYVAPSLTEAQRKALAAQQQKAFEQAVTAQRKFAESLNRERMAPPAPELPTDIQQRIQDHEAKRDAMLRERQSRFNTLPGIPPRVEGIPPRREESPLRRSDLLNQLNDQLDSLSNHPLRFETVTLDQLEKEM
jgi:hypothetical protein